jgi:hypothetical protein
MISLSIDCGLERYRKVEDKMVGGMGTNVFNEGFEDRTTENKYKFKQIHLPYKAELFTTTIDNKDKIMEYLNKVTERKEDDVNKRASYFYLKEGGIVILDSSENIMGLLCYCKQNVLNKLEKLAKN